MIWQPPDLSCHVPCLWGKRPPSKSLPSTSKHTTLISAAGWKPCLSKLCTCQRIPVFTGVNRALWAFAQLYERLLEIVSVSLSLSAYLWDAGRNRVSAPSQHPLRMFCIFWSLSGGQTRTEMCQTVRQMRFFYKMAHVFDFPWYDMHGPFSDLNVSPQSESVMMTVLQNGWMKLLTCQTEFSHHQTLLFFPHIFILCHHSFWQWNH